MARRVWCWGLVIAVVTGCSPGPPSGYVLAPQSQRLDAALRDRVAQLLLEHCGTPQRPKRLGDTSVSLETLQFGQAVYERNCQQCHGATGDGAGPTAVHLRPRPRDYRLGVFKFTSTPYGAKPRRDDLRRTISQGVLGTSMPSFVRLPKTELEATIDYVLSLTHRGEFETLLAIEAESSDELSDETVKTLIADVLSQWRGADRQVVLPVVPEPPRTVESIAAGRKIFETRECFKCHGSDGRGQIASNVGVDVWQSPTRAADLTSGMLHGGFEPLDVYRRIASGINGTPMPAFKDSFAEHPEQIWQLVHYVQDVADARRRGEPFVPSGDLVPTPLTPEGAQQLRDDTPASPAGTP